MPALTDSLFFAIYPDAAAASRIARLAQSAQAEHGLKGKPVAMDRLHVTLHHLGAFAGVPEAVVAMASDAASQIALAPFDVTFDRTSSFPGRRASGHRSARGLGERRPARTQATLGLALQAAGLAVKANSRYTPHVTLLYDEIIPPNGFRRPDRLDRARICARAQSAGSVAICAVGALAAVGKRERTKRKRENLTRYGLHDCVVDRYSIYRSRRVCVRQVGRARGSRELVSRGVLIFGQKSETALAALAIRRRLFPFERMRIDAHNIHASTIADRGILQTSFRISDTRMSRYCGKVDPKPILDAAAHWRDVALLGEGSVLTTTKLWTNDAVDALHRYFVQRLDVGEGDFLLQAGNAVGTRGLFCEAIGCRDDVADVLVSKQPRFRAQTANH